MTFTEASSADSETVLADYTTSVGTDTASSTTLGALRRLRVGIPVGLNSHFVRISGRTDTANSEKRKGRKEKERREGMEKKGGNNESLRS